MHSPRVTRIYSACFTALMVMPLAALTACDDSGRALAPADMRGDASPQASLGSVPRDTDAIMDLVATATAAWTAKDAAGYASVYAQDMQLVTPIGTRVSGRTAFEAQHAFLFTGPFAGSTQTIDVVDITFLTGTIAIVQQDVTLTGYAFLPPGLPSSGNAVRTSVAWVVVKRGGDWEIVYQHMTPLL